MATIAIIAFVFDRNAAVQTNMPFCKRQFLHTLRAKPVPRVLHEFVSASVASYIERIKRTVKRVEHPFEQRFDFCKSSVSFFSLLLLFILDGFVSILNFAIVVRIDTVLLNHTHRLSTLVR